MGVTDPGPRDHLITQWLQQALAGVDGDLVDEIPLDDAEAPERLARHAMELLRSGLADGEHSASDQSRLINDLLRAEPSVADDGDAVALPARILRGIRDRSPLGEVLELPPPPATPFSQSDLLVNAEGQPNIGAELKAELASAERVDLICAFVIWSGVRHLREALASVVARGGQVRVITTTYMGATEKAAVDALVDLGADVRVALDARTTKLHAKAWLLERGSGLTTAYVGSSNLSHTALFDGLEWNVRLSSVDAGRVINRIRMTFESHWASEHFEAYDPAVNGDELAVALKESDRRSVGQSDTITFANLDVRPYPHQRRMLETLSVERSRHQRHENLVVAATGTGKTVVAALDYAQLRRDSGEDLSLLFVAHRNEILQQALATYRAVLKDGSFGEVHGGGRAAAGAHVFAMVQSLSEERIAQISPDAFDVVVIDEFHHAAAPTYDRLLHHLEPKELLGLTATPERLDGQDITEWFGGRISVELRLWEAIDQGFLVPFQYFGVADGTDLSGLTWRRGGYATEELADLLSNDDLRVAKLIAAIQRIVLDPSDMRALGFCVSVEHARYMARKFTDAGLKSVALSGEDTPAERRQVLAALDRGQIRCIFSVEVLGEGVDVPNVDCLFLLRPTSSPTVFTQQLGRGLRRADGKSHLTVIDLIGQHRREFRFEDRLRAIVDTKRGSVERQVDQGFPFLPAGCTIDLDRKSREIVLDNLKQSALQARWNSLVSELRSDGRDAIRLTEYLADYDRRLENIYRRGSWTALKRAAGKPAADPVDADLEETALRAIRRLTHIDDAERIAFYGRVLSQANPPGAEGNERHRRLLTMLAWGLGSRDSGAGTLEGYFEKLWLQPEIRRELVELLEVLDAKSTTPTRPSFLSADVPLNLHARYSRQEVVAALGYGDGVKPKVTQGGVLWVPEASCDVFFVDLRKSERDYSPTTMYRDYAINRELFHWESQSRQAPHQATVQRYINHAERGSRVLLFVREHKRNPLGGAGAFTFLGPVEYVEHKGERPVAFTWRLSAPMPEELFEVARSVAAA